MDRAEVTITLPFPPSANRYWRYVTIKGAPRVLISKAGRQYREAVGACLVAARARPLADDLAVEITLHPPDRRKRDADNSLKCLLDSLQHGGLFEDDSQITDLTVRKRHPVEGGKAMVRVVQV